jgi:hypothetical protein
MLQNVLKHKGDFMIYAFFLVELIMFGLVFFRLVTTNHWTIGKKLMVALSAGILVETAGFVLAMAASLDPTIVLLIKLPKILVGIAMVYFFYRHEITH